MTTSKTILGLAFSALALTTGSASAAIVDPVTIDFEGMAFGSYAGHANIEPVAGGNCPGTGGNGCYYEDGFAIGIVADPTNPIAHLHQNEAEDFSFLLGYHADSSGIYIRAIDGSAFSLQSLDFHAPLRAGNRDNGPDDVWEILGFNTALNPDLASGDGTNYPTRVAYQTVANGFDGTLELDEAFNNINAFWIHYKGYPLTPADGKRFAMELDNIVLGAPVSAVPIPAAVWLFGTGLMGLVSLGRRKAGAANA
ncbi:VPLPA-CTERM sorting domain-containing protein [Methylocaldum szegediense]|uniref:VPLPA-CTERM sorting domain-containing protein n=1 Tax=Methylocaldum szegediense TaxID=73780 RepID=UPI00047A7B6A|nr:VPLPA-CTERM sorting domain-containing protein [Methylocaldum szegediense]